MSYVEDIKKNAPVGAKFYVVEFGCVDYINCANGRWYVWQNNDWVLLHSLIVAGYRGKMVRL